MKRLILLPAALVLLALAGCVGQGAAPKLAISAHEARARYKDTPLTVTPMDAVTVTRHTVTIAPAQENVEYTISGYFNGQIVTTTKNTVLRLQDAYLENTAGKAAVRCEAKASVSAAKGSTSYIVSGGRSASKNAALQGKRTLVLGGAGTLYVRGNVCHAVEAEDVKIKGTGAFYMQGTRNGSALNCESLEVEPEKTFTAYFLNSKNGIKADRTITVASGTFCLYDNGTALKTDTAADSKKHAHAITLTGGTFRTHANGTLYATEAGAYTAAGATFVEE